MQIRFKKIHPDAQLPTKAFWSDSGWDVYAVKDFTLLPEDFVVPISTGLQLAQISQGYEIQVRSRSGNTLHKCCMVANQPGTIDNQYRGEIKILMWTLKEVTFKKGEKIAQLVPIEIPISEVAWSEEVSETPRNDGGFGSSDKEQP